LFYCSWRIGCLLFWFLVATMAANLSATSLSMISQRPKSPIRVLEDKNCCFWTRPSCYLKQRNIIKNVSGGTSRKGTTLVSASLSTIARKSASAIPAFNEVCLSHSFFKSYGCYTFCLVIFIFFLWFFFFAVNWILD